jgi:hypothetical protein
MKEELGLLILDPDFEEHSGSPGSSRIIGELSLDIHNHMCK